MCLEITKKSIAKTKELKNSKKPIIAYKILKPNRISIFRDFQWELGENVSSRESSELTEDEIEDQEIHEGFHFFLEKPEICRYQCQNPSQYHCRCRCQYQCSSNDSMNEVYKVEINPENLIAVGTWENTDSIAATKATLIERIK